MSSVSPQSMPSSVREDNESPRSEDRKLSPDLKSVIDSWSQKQRNIVSGVVAGEPYETLAGRLNTTIVMIKYELHEIYNKTGTSSRLELSVLLTNPEMKEDANPAFLAFLNSLIPKERAIAELLANQGMSNKEIANTDQVHTTEAVVKNYIKTLFDKVEKYTGIKRPENRVELAQIILRALSSEATHKEKAAEFAWKIDTMDQWRIVAGQVIQYIRKARGDDIEDVVESISQTRVERMRRSNQNVLGVVPCIYAKIWDGIEKGDPTLNINLFKSALREVCHIYYLEPPEPEALKVTKLLDHPLAAG